MRTVDDRVSYLERGLSVPGTQIVRVLGEGRGLQWCVALGELLAPKRFFYGHTIDEALRAAANGVRVDREKIRGTARVA
jgi:hypothetical protein